MTLRQLLVLDDEVDFAEFVARTAGDLGFDAVLAASPEDFKARYLEAPPDIIVLDIVMPEMDGIELVRWLKDNDCRARIIIISGFDPTYARAAREIGQSGFLNISQMQKPVKLADLRAELVKIEDNDKPLRA